jgi:hypothetical protein
MKSKSMLSGSTRFSPSDEKGVVLPIGDIETVNFSMFNNNWNVRASSNHPRTSAEIMENDIATTRVV